MKYRMLEPEEMTKQYDLKAIPGKKLRMQFFTFPLVIIPCFFLFVLYMAWVAMLLFGDFSFSELWELTLFAGAICIPTVLLCTALLALNHHFFGKIVCVLSPDGIVHAKGLIRWNRIQKIEYVIQFPDSRSYIRYREFCHAVIYTVSGQIKIDHAPLCLLWYVKKRFPDLPVGLTRSCRNGLLIFAGILALIPFLCFALFALLGS